MNLAEKFRDLSAEKKRVVHFELCENALAVLNRYFDETGEIKYVESVTGTRQIVDKKLPANALLCAQTGTDTHNAEYRFMEPLAAFQDEDIPFPGEIEIAYYSIYNLLQKYVLNKKIDDWLIVNQASAAESQEEKWIELLSKAIEKTDEQSNP